MCVFNNTRIMQSRARKKHQFGKNKQIDVRFLEVF